MKVFKMRNSDTQRMIDMIQNALAGEKVVCDDTTEYSIGTREAHEAFVKKRNESLEMPHSWPIPSTSDKHFTNK
jgi:hypothetical protein